jgi:hypothetical protein
MKKQDFLIVCMRSGRVFVLFLAIEDIEVKEGN